MDQIKLLVFLCLYVGCEKALNGAAADNPGFKIKLTSKGLAFGNDVLVDLLMDRVKSAIIPDLKGKEFGVKYTISQLKVTKFPRPSSSATIDPTQGVAWRATEVGATLRGRYLFETSFFGMSDRGTFDVTLAGLTISLRLSFDKDKAGNPTVKAYGCMCSIGTIDITTNSFILQMVQGLFIGKVKELLQGSICTLLTDTINSEASQKLATIPVFGQMSLGNITQLVNVQGALTKDFMLDNRLVLKPSFQRNAMETHHKGRVYARKTDRMTSLVAPPLSSITDSSRMVYLQISTYVFNTLLEVAHQHGIIVYSFTKRNVPLNFREFLNTSCGSFRCIGAMIPEIGRNFPDSSCELQLRTAEAPTVTIYNNIVVFHLTGEVTLAARQTNGAVSPVFTLLAGGLYNITLTIQNGKILYEIVMPTLNLSVRNSTIGPINEDVMRLALESAVKQILEPKLNEFGSMGISISTLAPDGINLARPTALFNQNSVTFAADVEYKVGGGKNQFLSQILQ